MALPCRVSHPLALLALPEIANLHASARRGCVKRASPRSASLVKLDARNGARPATLSAGGCDALFDSIV